MVMLLGVLVSVVAPISFRFYYTRMQAETTQTILNTLRKAQLSALYDTHDSKIGVKVLPTEVVLFQGDSYDLRTQSEDTYVEIEPPLTLSGDTEVVFIRKTGSPVLPVELSFAHYVSTTTITVFASGLIEQQR